MSNTNIETPVIINALRVPNGQRFEFLPKFFGDNFILGETLVYRSLRALCKDYQGGYWHFYELDNSGFYMAPDSSDPLHLVWAGNFFDGYVSADAAGIIATLYGLNQLIEMSHSESLVDAYYNLRDFIHQHPEANQIWRAID